MFLPAPAAGCGASADPVLLTDDVAAAKAAAAETAAPGTTPEGAAAHAAKASAWSIFTFSHFFAVQILKEPATESLIRLLALSFPFASVHLCVNSYYLGLKKASFPAATQILEQAVRIFSTCLLWQICLSRNIAVTAMIQLQEVFSQSLPLLCVLLSI